MLKLKTLATTSSGLLLAAGIVATAAALPRQGDAVAGSASTRPVDGAVALRATLSDGREVAVFAVGLPGKGWWNPSGGPPPETVGGLPFRDVPTDHPVAEGEVPLSVAMGLSRRPGIPDVGERIIAATPEVGVAKLYSNEGISFVLGVPSGETSTQFGLLVPVGKPVTETVALDDGLDAYEVVITNARLTFSPLRTRTAADAATKVFVTVSIAPLDELLVDHVYDVSLRFADGTETVAYHLPRPTRANPYTWNIHLDPTLIGEARAIVVRSRPAELAYFHNLATGPDSKAQATAAVLTGSEMQGALQSLLMSSPGEAPATQPIESNDSRSSKLGRSTPG